jgi:hypothetical protein
MPAKVNTRRSTGLPPGLQWGIALLQACNHSFQSRSNALQYMKGATGMEGQHACAWQYALPAVTSGSLPMA